MEKLAGPLPSPGSNNGLKEIDFFSTGGCLNASYKEKLMVNSQTLFRTEGLCCTLCPRTSVNIDMKGELRKPQVAGSNLPVSKEGTIAAGKDRVVESSELSEEENLVNCLTGINISAAENLQAEYKRNKLQSHVKRPFKKANACSMYSA